MFLLLLILLMTHQEGSSLLFDESNPFARALGDNNDFSMVENRVVGGVETEPHSWPWTVQLLYKGGHTCGGALIDQSFVVTAGHCVFSQRPDHYTVLTGGHRSKSGQLHKVLNISVHPLFNVLWPGIFDVAFVKISPKVEFGDRAQAIALPSLPPIDNQMCVVAGWGHLDEDGTRSNILREVQVPIVPAHICNDWHHYRFQIHTPTMVCAGYSHGGRDSCAGDSGGPLMCERGGKWELQGVVSWGEGCGRPGFPGVYARILPALAFIKTMMFLLR
ncbi:hypothetical protein PENTCL1PPCAC_5781 [Pristionchus entomophagus]|uniref:Peptidase S1 domain-containing protein n=1 Tax=Pristionchus entomophagus TaxID=358040 RepID=A0AAV5SJV5_9BILA|nr:hypothetical protein PENTCL1PPCAC_5781 [Pristionchus entomophagus]